MLVSSPLNIYSGGFLDHMVVSFLVLSPPSGTLYWFPQCLHQLTFPQQSAPSQHFYFWIIAILTGVRWYLRVAFPRISLTTVRQHLFKQPRMLLTQTALFVIGVIEVLSPLQPENCFSIISDLPCPFVRIVQKETDNIEYILTFKFPD